MVIRKERDTLLFAYTAWNYLSTNTLLDILSIHRGLRHLEHVYSAHGHHTNHPGEDSVSLLYTETYLNRNGKNMMIHQTTWDNAILHHIIFAEQCNNGLGI